MLLKYNTEGNLVELLLDRYRLMGRAGAGGYATVQHAYDTRLKRDVAIKCIQITQEDIKRSKISIHDAQVLNASRPLTPAARRRQQARLAGGAVRQRRVTATAVEVQYAEDDIVPFDNKIREPSFLDRREKDAAKRARDRAIKQGVYGDNETKHYRREDARRGRVRDTEDYEDPKRGRSSGGFVELERFEPSGNPRKRAASRLEVLDARATNNTVRLGDIPGRISGVGEARIDRVGEHSVAIDDLDSEVLEAEYVEPRGRHDSPKTAKQSLIRSSERSRQIRAERYIDDADIYGEDFEQLEIEYDEELDIIPGLEEARTAAHLNDVNIVTVYDCVVEGNMAYVIMEYVEGKTLARIMHDLGNDITLDIIASVFNSVSHALEVAHKANVLHLDVKPENVIINAEGIVKVTDFGLSTLMDSSGQGVTGGGTIGYMPLEQMRQQRLDVRTDEWALASLTYEMLSGKNPFKARNLREAETAIEGAELVLPSLCWEAIDESVDDIMFDALSPNMEGRYRSIEEFSDELSPLLGDEKEGTKQLAAAINDMGRLLPERKTEQRPKKPYLPLVDRLGVAGSNIVMRATSAIGAALIVVVALLNMKFGVDPVSMSPSLADSGATTFGLFSTVTWLAWILLVGLIALTALFPKFGFPACYAVFVVMLMSNQAWLVAILFLVGTGAWWWYFGRESDLVCTVALLSPIFGSFGFASLAPIVAGALMDVRDALFATIMASLSALAFASLGSYDVTGWNIVANAIVAVNPNIAGASISAGFLSTISVAENWIIIASWIAAAFVYSLICRKGTHTFDILASVAAAAILLLGMLILPIITGDYSVLTPLIIASTIISGLIGVGLAVLNIPDRVRMAPGEW